MSEERRTIWSFIRPEFSVGSAVNTLIAAGILGWVITSSSSMATLSERLQDFQASMLSFQEAVNTQLSSMHAVIDGLPAQTVIINDMQVHLHAIDARLDVIEERIRAIELSQRTDEAHLESLQQARASSQPSGGSYPP